MVKTLIFIYFLSITLVFVSCGENKISIAVKETIGKKIELQQTPKETTKFTILRYVNNPACTSCQLKLGEWKIYKRMSNRRFGNIVGFLFICETKNIDETSNLLRTYGFGDDSCVDSINTFYESNGLNPNLGKDVVFLLDSNNKVLAIGNPTNNHAVDSLFVSIIDGAFFKIKQTNK